MAKGDGRDGLPFLVKRSRAVVPFEPLQSAKGLGGQSRAQIILGLA